MHHEVAHKKLNCDGNNLACLFCWRCCKKGIKLLTRHCNGLLRAQFMQVCIHSEVMGVHAQAGEPIQQQSLQPLYKSDGQQVCVTHARVGATS